MPSSFRFQCQGAQAGGCALGFTIQDLALFASAHPQPATISQLLPMLLRPLLLLFKMCQPIHRQLQT